MTDFQTERFLPTAEYDALADRLADIIRPCPVRGVVTANEIKIAIGEVMNLWPESLRPILIREELADRGLIAPFC